MNYNDAISEARETLLTEADRLSHFLRQNGVEMRIRTDAITAYGDQLPHRVAIGIYNEMNRLREVAKALVSPDCDSEDDNDEG